MEEIILYSGTNNEVGRLCTEGKHPDITWWSGNIETLEHYYEGVVLEMKIKLDQTVRQDYIAEVFSDTDGYTFGYAAMNCPKGAVWYSFSNSYIATHAESINVISLEDAITRIRGLNSYA